MAFLARGRSPFDVATPPMFDVVCKGFDRGQVTDKITALTEELSTERHRAEQAELALRQSLERIDGLEQARVGDQHGFGDRVERVLVLAEQQAGEITTRAEEQARQIVQDTHATAEAHHRNVEEALLSRAAGLDHEAAQRSAQLQRQEDEIAASRVAARRQAEDYRAAAERDAAHLRERALTEVDELPAAAKAAAQADRDNGTRELARLIDMQNGVRAELYRMTDLLGGLREILTEELTTPGGYDGQRRPAVQPPGTTSSEDTGSA